MTPDFAATLFAYVAQAAALLALFAAAAAAARCLGSAGHAPALWAFGAVGLAGYAAFFASLPGRAGSSILAGGVAAAAVAGLALKRHLRAGDLLAPALSLAAGLLYLGAAHLGIRAYPGHLAENLGFERVMTSDDVNPLNFAEALYHRLPSRTGQDAYGWFFSDRPPLQAGLVLLFSPLWRVFEPGLAYRALGTALQASAVGATWLLCRSLGFGRGEARFATLAFALSGFAYYESVYAWPKLLAAAYLFAGCAALGPALVERRRAAPGEALLLGLSVGLALLSHGAIAFAVIPLVLLVAGTRLLDLRGALYAGTTVLCLYAPWAAYTRFVDPNDDKLIRLHLTDTDPDARGPILEALWASYSRLTFERWLTTRVDNLALLWGEPDTDALALRLFAGLRDAREQVPLAGAADLWTVAPAKLHYDLVSLGTVLRADQTSHMFRAVGLFNLAWPLLLLAAVPRLGRRLDRGWVALAVLTASSCLTFATLEFGTDAVTIHGPYSIVMALFVLAAIWLRRLWRRGAWWLFGANAALTLLVWVAFAPGAMMPPVHRLQPVPLLVAFAALAILVALLSRTGRAPAPR